MRSRLSSASRILSNRLLLLLMLGWGAYGPILGNRLPHADDLGFHQLRLAQLSELARHAIVFSRWFPDLAHGYGYPLFNFMAPLAYYFALPWTLLGLSVPQALQISFALGIVLAGWTMQRLLADWLPALPALAGGVAFMYAPYFSYDVLFRGNYGESLALCWMPLALWAGGRAARGDGPRWAALGGLAYAAVVLSHNVSGLIFSPLLALYAAAEWWGSAARDRARRAAHVALTLAIGLALSAFFWLPALTETDAIALDRLMNNASYDYRNNFQPWAELLAWPTLVFRDRLNPSPPPALGLIPLLLGLSGWLRWRQASVTARRHLLLWSALLAGFLLLLRPLSLPLWDALPLIEFLQFPWRLLAVASLLPALLIGWSLALWCAALPPRAAVALPLLAIALVIVAAQPWLYPAYGTRPAAVTVADIVPYEVATNTLGATATGEYLPATVRAVPDGPPAWRLRLADGDIAQLDDRPLGLTAEVVARGAQTVTFSQFAFAGWWAAVDGRRVPIAPSDPHGLVTFDVPDGRSIVTVGFGPTPLRWAATVISLASLLVASALLWHGRGSALPAAPNALPGTGALLGLIAIGIVGGIGLPQLRPTRLAADGTLRGASAAPVLFDGGLWLLNAEIPALVSADRAFNVTLYWRAEQTPQANLLTTVALRDETGVLWSPKKSETPPRFRPAIPTNAWPTDRYALDVQRVVPLAGTPPGRYEVVVTLFERASLRPRPVRGSTTTQVVIGAVDIARPTVSPDLTPAVALDAPIDGGLRLLGYTADRAAARPGDPLLLTLFWQADGTTPAAGPLLLRLTLNSASGNVAHSVDVPLDWTWVQPGDRWQTQHALRLPANLVGGRYHWGVVICRPLCAAAHGLASVAVDAPARLYAPPPVEQLVEEAIGPAATLHGINVDLADSTLDVSAVWLATGTTTTSYRAFVHVLAADGTLIAQSDAEPGQWSRPTTGWLPGEYVVDRHVLTVVQLPDGAWLRVGLYEPETGIWPGPPVELALER